MATITCPDGAKENDVHIQTEKIRPFKAPNGEMLSGTDGGILFGDDLSSIAWIYTGDNGGWQAFAFETESGNKFIWDSEKAWYTMSGGKEFNDSWTFDIVNAVGANITPVVQMAVDSYTKGDAFKSIKDAVERHDGGLASFAWQGTKESVSDLFSGGRKGSQARLSAFTGVLSSGGTFGLLASSEVSILNKSTTIFTNADGALFGTLVLKLPFDLKVQRFGTMKFADGSLDHWGPTLFGTNASSARAFNAMLPEWKNPLTDYTRGIIPKGTLIKIGITGPQGVLHPGGLLQFQVSSKFVIGTKSTFIKR